MYLTEFTEEYLHSRFLFGVGETGKKLVVSGGVDYGFVDRVVARWHYEKK